MAKRPRASQQSGTKSIAFNLPFTESPWANNLGQKATGFAAKRDEVHRVQPWPKGHVIAFNLQPSTKQPSTKQPSTKQPSTKQPSTKQPS
ncbi:hypothetical protein BJP36_40845 [Moorena producens JHB]|uniref:Uncharacterized protein n=1 Tax=Moorena producens (strain JHB) TaxID=1454205 RepID=A0A9Q9SS90_MOOP1|nr:hypothetical protein [Moorena producens]WAN68714.1 hypothetical protein BJP36_40845 [Moorena producens JHB]